MHQNRNRDLHKSRNLNTNMNIRMPKSGGRIISERKGSLLDDLDNLRTRIKLIEGQMDGISKKKNSKNFPIEKSSENILTASISDLKKKFKEEINEYIESYFSNHLTEILNMIKLTENRFEVKKPKNLKLGFQQQNINFGGQRPPKHYKIIIKNLS